MHVVKLQVNTYFSNYFNQFQFLDVQDTPYTVFITCRLIKPSLVITQTGLNNIPSLAL